MDTNVYSCSISIWKIKKLGQYSNQNLWYPNGGPSHVTLTFEYPTPKVSGIQMVTIDYFKNRIWMTDFPKVDMYLLNF